MATSLSQGGSWDLYIADSKLGIVVLRCLDATLATCNSYAKNVENAVCGGGDAQNRSDLWVHICIGLVGLIGFNSQRFLANTRHDQCTLP